MGRKRTTEETESLKEHKSKKVKISEDGLDIEVNDTEKVKISEDDIDGELNNSENEKVLKNSIIEEENNNIENEPANEYIDDSSDEEDLRNTRGNVPVEWYQKLDHVGYDKDGNQITKAVKFDSLDQLLDRLSNPNYYRTVFDKQTGSDVKISDEDMSIVKRLMKHQCADANINMYEKFEDLFSHEVMEMPLSGRDPHKRSFLQSKAERREVRRLATLVKKGLLKKKRKRQTEENYDIWDESDPNRPTEFPKTRKTKFMIAPKEDLPGVELSYHPPPEFITNKPDDMSIEDFAKQVKQEAANKAIRNIPSDDGYIENRTDRLTDVYFGYRQTQKIPKKISSTNLVPNLPDKKDLRPYPTMEGMRFKGHRSIVRTISVHRNGKLLATGSDDCQVRVWEIHTGRCIRTFFLDGPIKCVAWNPNPNVCLLAVCLERKVVMLNPESYLVDADTVRKTNAIFKVPVDQGDYEERKSISKTVKWRKPDPNEWKNGIRLVLDFNKSVTKVTWHNHGDYFVTIMPEGISKAVLVHQLARWRSANMCKKTDKVRYTYIQTAEFHPKKPYLYVATKQQIRIYNLKRKRLRKLVKIPCKWISSVAAHPISFDFVVSSFDDKLFWFEDNYTKRPHFLKFHSGPIRSVKMHKKYPLFATCSDDGSIVVTHHHIYNDFLTDPTILPLKKLYGHLKFEYLHALDMAWHPIEAHLFTAGADGFARMWH